jgi:MazG family protein
MPLLVVCVAEDEAGLLTLGEWDALVSCKRVVFERPSHPLAARLVQAGIPCGPFDDEPAATQDGWALVADPGSPRVPVLAERGARVLAGPADYPDGLTAARAAPLARKVASSLAGVAGIMARLRGPDGCPWDARQTHESLRVHLMEEAYEVLEAIDAGQTGAELEEELGDLLLQIAFHSELAHEDGRFDMASLAQRLAGKLVHRHPHVFGDVEVAGADDVVTNWEALKQTEKQRRGPFEGIPLALPALLTAYKTQKRAASLGFSPAESDARRRLDEALADDPGPREIGDALFWLVAVARTRGIDPEGALRAAVARFQQARVG